MKIFDDKSSSDKTQRSQTSDQSTRALGSTEFKGYKIHSAFRGKFKVKHESFYSSGGGLEGATNSSRSIPSAIRVAAAMKVSMKSWKLSFLVLATCMAASFSSRTSLQWTRTRDRATSAPHLAEDFFHSATRVGTLFSRVIKDSRSFASVSPGQRDASIRDIATFNRDR